MAQATRVRAEERPANRTVGLGCDGKYRGVVGRVVPAIRVHTENIFWARGGCDAPRSPARPGRTESGDRKCAGWKDRRVQRAIPTGATGWHDLLDRCARGDRSQWLD